MKERIKLKGIEEDFLTSWRRVLVDNHGKTKYAKRSYRRRLRKQLKEEIRNLEE